MQFHQYRDFPKGLQALHKRGGGYQRAADQVHALLSRITSGYEKPFGALNLTHHGESRIKHCLKYDLSGYCRLVTVRTENICVLCFVGDHDDADGWIDCHRGFTPVVGRDRIVVATFESPRGLDPDTRVQGNAGFTTGPLYERLLSNDFDRLVDPLSRRVARTLEALTSASLSDEILAACADIEDEVLRGAVYDVFELFRQDNERAALDRLRLYFGDVEKLVDIEPGPAPAYVDGDLIRSIPVGSGRYAEYLKRFAETGAYKDWMLYLNAEQQAVVDRDFTGSAKLIGVSGSGKTCVVVRRAARLAAKYAGSKILVLTLNRPLAAMISALVDVVCEPEHRANVEVTAFFDLCRRLVLGKDPAADRRLRDVTWKSNEHVDEVWQEYYRCELNNSDARVLQPLHDSLLSRRWSAERYLREELDWIRSAVGRAKRNDYLAIERVGRAVPLATDQRALVLKGLSGWEKKMAAVGVVDSLGLAEHLVDELHAIRNDYRCVLVDESQDFGNIELLIIRRLVGSGENDIFLCGDIAQQVSTKFQRLRDVDISVPSNSSISIRRNYRNSKDVLKAAYAVLSHSDLRAVMQGGDFEFLDPEYSEFSASTPLTLRGRTLEDEIAFAVNHAKSFITDNRERKACICICGHSIYELLEFGKGNGLQVLDGSIDIEAGSLFVSDLEQTKGFEFDMVIIVNCRNGVLPRSEDPESEQFRDLCRLYVAMTRAKTDLIISYSGAPSAFLVHAIEASEFASDDWSAYSEVKDPLSIGVPPALESTRAEGVFHLSLSELTAEQFLYRKEAIGLSSQLIAKMRELVDGQGVTRGSARVKWGNLGFAAKDFRGSPISRQQWGPVTGREFSELIEKLRI